MAQRLPSPAPDGACHAPASVRLFVALWPGPAARRQLVACRDRQPWPAGARPVPDGALHLTLHFIGAVPVARVDEVAAALDLPSPGFDLVLDRVAAWPHGLVVLEAGHVPDALRQLHADLGAALRRLALPLEARPLRPHVTLARRAGDRRAWVQAEPLHWRVRGHVLVQSGMPSGVPSGAPPLPQVPYRVRRRYG